jgi:hypothetical protein
MRPPLVQVAKRGADELAYNRILWLRNLTSDRMAHRDTTSIVL